MTVLLKPDSNLFHSFILSSVDKVTIIINSVASVAEEVAKFLDQVKIRLSSQLINDILRVLQKLIKYFNGTDSSTFFVLRTSGSFPVISILDLNGSDSVILSFD